MIDALRRGAAALPAALLALATPAFAQQGPEQLDQIEPGMGEWQAEYFGAIGGDGQHGLELLAGVTDRLVLGAEAELEGPRGGLRFESIGLVMLYRLSDPATRPLGIGIALSGALGRDGRLRELESRLLLERRTPRWWLQGDLILRHSRDEGLSGTGLAFAVSAQHALGGSAWLGVEASGQLARIGGAPELAPTGSHYAGPSLTIERPIGDAEIELGFAWLQRVKGDGPGSGPRLFAQFTF